MKKFLVSAVHEKAKERPEGYAEDILSSGRVVGDYVELDDAVYAALCRKYRPPSALGMAKSLATSMVAEGRAILTGQPALSKEQVAERMALCQGCSQFDPVQIRCRVCRCWLLAKTALRSETCPLGKWGVISAAS